MPPLGHSLFGVAMLQKHKSWPHRLPVDRVDEGGIAATASPHRGERGQNSAELFFAERRTRSPKDVPLLAESFTGGRAEIAPGIFLIKIAGSPSPQEFDSFLDDMAVWLDAMRAFGEKVALIVDPSQLTRFDAPMRRSYGVWRGTHRPLIEATCSRAAYVTQDAMWRGIMTAVFWFAKPVVPVELCASRQVALDWLKAPMEGE